MQRSFERAGASEEYTNIGVLCFRVSLNLVSLVFVLIILGLAGFCFFLGVLGLVCGEVFVFL